MQKSPERMDLMLPYGEALRGFMEQTFVSVADLKHTLRSRGVFLGRNEKHDSVPVLVCCLLSPREFDQLRECQAIKEDNPKCITRTIAWGSSTSLLDAIPSDLALASLVGDYTNYCVLGTPTFVPVSGNHDSISCEFEIERIDYSKNWTNVKSIFKGELRIDKFADGTAIKFTLTHTAEETKDLTRKLVQLLEQRFKDNGYVNRTSELETIRFSSFSNEGRIAFFRSLTDKMKMSAIKFSKITDFGLCPEKSVKLPRELKWMEDTVSDFTVRGDALQNTFFIKGKDFHKYILFYSIEAKFMFEYVQARGSCSIVFEFPGFATKKDSAIEFELNISALSIDSDSTESNRSLVKAELLRRINDFKLAQFEKHRTSANERTVPVSLGLPIQLEAPLGLETTP